MLQVTANVRCGWQKVSADAMGQLVAHLLNFKYLVDESIVEPTLVEAKLLVDGRNASAFLSSHKPLYINISQGMLLTLPPTLPPTLPMILLRLIPILRKVSLIITLLLLLLSLILPTPYTTTTCGTTTYTTTYSSIIYYHLPYL